MKDKPPKIELKVFTIGHSNHSIETFLDLLKQQQIEVIVDVRSNPYSRYATHFNKETIQQRLQTKGIKYLFWGDILGGRPEGDEFYDHEGYVLYEHLAHSPKFQYGINRLLKGIQPYCVSLLCGEEDPTSCHRRLLIGRVLLEHNVKIFHIRGNGHIQCEEDVAKEEELRNTRGQMNLPGIMEPQEIKGWKSAQSVSQKKPQLSSLRFSNKPASNV